ncbi:MAG: hypothetical protein CM1200mP34_3470 [Verrucomicrobiales bacterium]|nr:MAG: hypothetical protein CM1200mP34_3470 [Verrucomicrobiales bacterium]
MKIRLERIEGNPRRGPVESPRFPFALGQAKECDLRIEAKGVWGRHLVLDDEGENGITATPSPDALVFVNGDAHRKKFRVNHGDLLELGAAKFRFWFAPLGQADRCGLEGLIWVALLLLALGQAGVIVWLMNLAG